VTDETNGQPGSQGERAGEPSESAMLDAIECADQGAFEAFVGSIRDERLAGRLRAMRADRAALIAATPEPAPARLGQWALDDAFGVLDPDALAALEATPASIDGPPVSVIQPYREGVLARLWRFRGVLGVAAAAALLIVAGVGVNSGVRALRSRLSAPAAPPERIAAAPGIEQAPEPAAVVEAPDAGVSVERWAARPLAAPEAWGAEPLADVFAAAPHLGSGRLVVCARSGSAQTTETLMDGLAGQSIGTAHSFGVGGPLDDSALASIGMPEPEAPVIASADGGPARAVLPLRRGWRARVRRSPAALAALRKTLEDAGMSVEFRLLPPSYPALERDADPTPDSVLWWSRPPGSWDRSVAVPVVIDSLPG
jgi:hypothetical protein